MKAESEREVDEINEHINSLMRIPRHVVCDDGRRIGITVWEPCSEVKTRGHVTFKMEGIILPPEEEK